MPSQYLYIARERNEPRLLKVGQTRRAPAIRRPGLRGQSNTDFDMLRVFPVVDAFSAERFARRELDARGARRDINKRRELFDIDFDQAQAICADAARKADLLSSRAGAPSSTSAVVAQHQLSAPSPFWAEMLKLPVRFDGKLIRLAELMALALESAPAARRLERFGIVCCAFRITRPEFRVDWSNAALREWRAQRGLAARDCTHEHVSFRRTAR